jgi:hypothetical protein
LKVHGPNVGNSAAYVGPNQQSEKELDMNPAMRHLRTALLVALFAISPAFARGSHTSAPRLTGTGSKVSSHSVRQYLRHGKIVKGHRSSTPDGTQTNNWTTNGNVNPWTGKPGTRYATH